MPRVHSMSNSFSSVTRWLTLARDRVSRLGNNRWRCAHSLLKNGRTRRRRDSSNSPTGSSTCGLVTSTSSMQKSLDAHLRSALLIHRASADHPFDACHPFGLLHQGIHVYMVHLTYRWMGELRKPSSLDPVGWIALRPVSGAAATVFFLREVLGLCVINCRSNHHCVL